MSIFNGGIDLQYSPAKVKDLVGIIVSIFGKDDYNFIKTYNDTYEVKYYKNDFKFRFFDVLNDNFTLYVYKGDWELFSRSYSDIDTFVSDMKSKFEKGFEDSYGDIAYFNENNENDETNTLDDENYSNIEQVSDDFSDSSDEEFNSEPLDDYSRGLKIAKSTSIVPDDITKIRVVALRYDGNILAFRFKTDKGAFDMKLDVAIKYGLGGFKTEKFINLECVNGVYMSSSEKKLRTFIPDISLCEEDCKKLINALFNS